MNVAPGKAGKRTFEIFVHHCAVCPLMSVGTAHAGTVCIIEEHTLSRDLVQVGSDAFAENAKRGIAVPLGNITENLVVCPILLDDVNDVLEHARLSYALGHRPGQLAGTRR